MHAAHPPDVRRSSTRCRVSFFNVGYSYNSKIQTNKQINKTIQISKSKQSQTVL